MMIIVDIFSTFDGRRSEIHAGEGMGAGNGREGQIDDGEGEKESEK
jgi:hypothetical protein